MSNTSLVVRNHLWPVGDHVGISPGALQLLEFFRIEARARGIASIHINTNTLELWKVVRGWRAADYADAINKLEANGSVSWPHRHLRAA